jgi:membrane protein
LGRRRSIRDTPVGLVRDRRNAVRTRKIIDSLIAAGRRYLGSGASDSAAAIAYRVLFALAPLAVALASVFGLLLQNDDLRQKVIDKIASALPVKGEDVTSAIENVATPASAAGLVSLVVLAWAASGMVDAIRTGLDRTMDVDEDRGVVRRKLLDLALVASTALLVLASVGVGMVTQLVNGLVGDLLNAIGVGADTAQVIVSKILQLLLWTVTVLFVYREIPAKRPSRPDALAGAVVAALLLLAISLAAGVIYAHATRWSFIYGSLTSVFVFLYSVYLFASAVLFGSAVASEWSRPRRQGATGGSGSRRG